MRTWLGLAGLALAFTFGCHTTLPVPRVLSPEESERMLEYRNQEAYYWSELEKMARETDDDEIDWLVERINFCFFKVDHFWYKNYDQSTFQVRNPNHSKNYIQFRKSKGDSWKGYSMGWDNSRALKALRSLIREYADRIAFRKIYIQK